MRSVLVDTSAYSALLRGQAALYRTVRYAEEILVSPVVLGELRSGFRRGTDAGRNEEVLQEFLDSPRVKRIAVDEETAHRYAAIHSELRRLGRPIPTNDLWIAASAMQHGSLLLTTDTHFRSIPQILSEIYPPN